MVERCCRSRFAGACARRARAARREVLSSLRPRDESAARVAIRARAGSAGPPSLSGRILCVQSSVRAAVGTHGDEKGCGLSVENCDGRRPGAFRLAAPLPARLVAAPCASRVLPAEAEGWRGGASRGCVFFLSRRPQACGQASLRCSVRRLRAACARAANSNYASNLPRPPCRSRRARRGLRGARELRPRCAEGHAAPRPRRRTRAASAPSRASAARSA